MPSVADRPAPPAEAPPRSLGRPFAWLWAAFAVSAFGTWFAFDAFPILAVTVLHVGPAAVSALAASGLAVGAIVALPAGPWVERRAKRPVMMAMDLVRAGALATVPIAVALGRLSLAQLVVVAVVVAVADIAFRAASGAFLRSIVEREQLLIANGRFESTQWTATMVGPPLGGAAIGALGAAASVVVNAASFMLSAASLRAIGRAHDITPEPAAGGGSRLSRSDLIAGWRCILADRALRPLFFNSVLVGALILATAPLLAVLMLRDLGFPPWEYALAFALPCAGGLLGSRLSAPIARRLGTERVIRQIGPLRACWSIGLAFVVPGVAGLLLVIAVQTAIVTSVGVFNPVYVTFRLQRIPPDLTARVLAAWSIASSATIASATALWGVLAALTGPRIAIAVAGVALAGTSLLLRGWRADP